MPTPKVFVNPIQDRYQSGDREPVLGPALPETSCKSWQGRMGLTGAGERFSDPCPARVPGLEVSG